jgi:two-component system CheB/CheR fusion protein
MRTQPFIVGVGASAGGLEALEQFFAEMPPDAGAAFVVVQHLSPDFRSVMDELLARKTTIPVTLVEDGMVVEPNHIYLIPPKKEMIVSGGRLLLSEKGRHQELALPIDIFFRSLARDAGDRAVGVVLSGGGSDGSRGIRDIHEAGGLVISQDEATAAFDGMPRSARDTGVVDYILAPARMPRVILNHIARVESGAVASASDAPPRGISAVYRLLYRAYGIDFTHYKPSTVTRRIERRLKLGSASEFDAYVERLAEDAFELDALYRDLLIGVTRFFRDAEMFELLETSVIPRIMQTSGTDEIRVWVPGCATGEEAYSIAILFHEALQRAKDTRRLKVFATDVHQGSLEHASRGLYGEESLLNISPPRLERYFERSGRTVQAIPELRQLIVFARHNVMRDAPFTRVDLVSCRNLLIYLQPIAQNRVLGLFHFALRNKGFLVLGPSESPGALTDDFEPVSNHWRIYMKQREHRVTFDRVSPVRLSERVAISSGLGHGPYPIAQTVALYDALLDEHMPPSLLLNERRQLIHAFGGAGRFVKVKDGRPSLDILDLVEPDLKIALTGALQRAAKDKAPVVYSGIRLPTDSGEAMHKLSVRPVFAKNAPQLHLLVSIENEDTSPEPRPAETAYDADQVSRDQLATMEAELRYTKENLQATIEEVETSNEELQATNEELLAANEELQSTNEELQSVNEELYTVNAEYQKKIAQLTELTNDMDNLLLATDVGTVFLDQDLCIRKFTPKIAQAFNLLPLDVGRPLGSFRSNLDDARLMADVESVRRNGQPIERQVDDKAGNHFYLRILPYRAAGAPPGVVLTLVDLNALKAAENALFQERHLLGSLMDSVPDGIYFKDGRGRFIRVNAAMTRMLGITSAEEAIGKRAADFVPDGSIRLDHPDERVLGGEAKRYELEEHEVPGMGARWFMTTRQPLRDPEGAIVGMFAVFRDVTEQKLAENEILAAVEKRDLFLAMLSHELRNPLAAIVTASRLLGGKQGDHKKEIEIISRQSRQMASLLDDLLEVNRITHNKIELERRVVDMREIIEEAVVVTAPLFESSRLELKVDLPSDPLWADVDPTRMQQVVVNILGNAAKYSPEGGGTVELRAARERGEILIAVKDQGIGIEPEMTEKIFELFVQGGKTLARTDAGMGVGLTLVRSLVTMHGGTVSAQSAGAGRGSTFTVRIPASEAAVEHIAERTSGTWGSGDGVRRIAIIDDNTDSCQMLEAFLKRFGHEVHCAFDGETGLQVIERAKPDIAIVDIGLPKLTGYEVASQVRTNADHKRMYLVALTGYGRPSDRLAAMQAGFDEHLVKPLQARDLERILQIPRTRDSRGPDGAS